jgi:ribonuclease-3
MSTIVFLDNYLFKEILELVDLDLKAAGDSNGCAQFHFMPRFVRELPGKKKIYILIIQLIFIVFIYYLFFLENGKEILSMNVVLSHLLNSYKPLIAKEDLETVINLPLFKWQNLVDEVKGIFHFNILN